jgi:hypothetical protein
MQFILFHYCIQCPLGEFPLDNSCMNLYHNLELTINRMEMRRCMAIIQERYDNS